MKMIIAVLILIGILLIIFLIRGLSGTRRSTAGDSRCNRIVVRDGGNVRKDVLGDDKGKTFEGVDDCYDTLVVEKAKQLCWKVSFLDINTQQIYRYRFCGKLIIGRKKNQGDSAQWLELSGDPKISKSHCIIYLKNNELFVRDMNSKNHTYLNGQPIDRDVKLKTGDILGIGKKKLKVEYGRG